MPRRSVASAHRRYCRDTTVLGRGACGRPCPVVHRSGGLPEIRRTGPDNAAACPLLGALGAVGDDADGPSVVPQAFQALDAGRFTTVVARVVGGEPVVDSSRPRCSATCGTCRHVRRPRSGRGTDAARPDHFVLDTRPVPRWCRSRGVGRGPSTRRPTGGSPVRSVDPAGDGRMSRCHRCGADCSVGHPGVTATTPRSRSRRSPRPPGSARPNSARADPPADVRWRRHS